MSYQKNKAAEGDDKATKLNRVAQEMKDGTIKVRGVSKAAAIDRLERRAKRLKRGTAAPDQERGNRAPRA